MRYPRFRCWRCLAGVVVLLLTMLPAATVSAQPDDDEAGGSADTPCTGSTLADYTTDPCGPSLVIPNWADGAGWNEITGAGSIQLFDLDGDGSDELIGQSQQGLVVYQWEEAWGQWLPASDLSDPLPFPTRFTSPNSIRIGYLADGIAGAVGVVASGDQVWFETWEWYNPTGAPGSGIWLQFDSSWPFSTDPGQLVTLPQYYETIQFLPEPLEGAGYGMIGRLPDGIHLCIWNHDATPPWSCTLATTAFNDQSITVDNGQAWPNNLADYYYQTIQFAPVYTIEGDFQLIGRDNTDGGRLQVYTWDAGSQTFQELDVSGPTPFDSSWNQPQYGTTIKPARFVANDPAAEVAGRGPDGVEWWAIWESGCGGNPAPCWAQYWGNGDIPFTDNAGYTAAQYYETIQYADLDGDGLDEVLGRDPQVGFTTWGLHQTWAWVNLANGPALTSGTSADPLWADPSYYQTIQTGTVGSGQPVLIARGKYGVRTWTWQGPNGWQRPLPYGFGNFATTAEDNAFALLNAYLSIGGDNTIRDSYTSLNSDVMANYELCLSNSISTGQTMPPTDTCELAGPVTPLANPNSVSAADWQNMVSIIEQEIAFARDVDGHFNSALSGILNDLYVLDQATFDNMVNDLFPTNQPGSGDQLDAIMQGLFWGFARGAAAFAGPEMVFAVNALGAVVTATESLQTSSGSTVSTTVGDLQAQMATAAGEAITRNNDFFEYVVGDGGLLNAYGTAISNQVWEIQDAQHDTAIANGQYQTALWLYKSLLPLKWDIWVCVEHNQPCDQISANIDPGINALILHDGGDQFWAYLSTGGAIAVDPGDAVFNKLMNDIDFETCSLEPGAGGNGWTYEGCNMELNVMDLLWYRDGWNWSCTVYIDYVIGHGANTEGCHDYGLPGGYPPD